jgi:hypothetical protein
VHYDIEVGWEGESKVEGEGAIVTVIFLYSKCLHLFAYIIVLYNQILRNLSFIYHPIFFTSTQVDRIEFHLRNASLTLFPLTFSSFGKGKCLFHFLQFWPIFL